MSIPVNGIVLTALTATYLNSNLSGNNIMKATFFLTFTLVMSCFAVSMVAEAADTTTSTQTKRKVTSYPDGINVCTSMFGSSDFDCNIPSNSKAGYSHFICTYTKPRSSSVSPAFLCTAPPPARNQKRPIPTQAEQCVYTGGGTTYRCEPTTLISKSTGVAMKPVKNPNKPRMTTRDTNTETVIDADLNLDIQAFSERTADLILPEPKLPPEVIIINDDNTWTSEDNTVSGGIVRVGEKIILSGNGTGEGDTSSTQTLNPDVSSVGTWQTWSTDTPTATQESFNVEITNIEE